jgi:maltose O-acetyltransferase
MSQRQRFGAWLGKLKETPISAAGQLADLARARWLFRNCEVGEGVAATGMVHVEGPGLIHVAPGTTILGGMVHTELISHRGATLRIGEGSVANYGVSIEAWEAVTIGRRCLMGSFVRVSDRARGETAPVVIGDDVSLAHGVIIEPGVTVGAGSEVTAGSVVTHDVPPGSLASGNPAQCVPLEPPHQNGHDHQPEERVWQSN